MSGVGSDGVNITTVGPADVERELPNIDRLYIVRDTRDGEPKVGFFTASNDADPAWLFTMGELALGRKISANAADLITRS